MTSKSFRAQLGDFERKAERKIRAVIQQSAQEVFKRAQTPQPSVKETGGSFEVGKIPVDLGDLRRSFVSGLNGGRVATGSDAYTLAVARFQVGDTIEGGWTAEYARSIEYGTDSFPGRFYMHTHAAQWQQIVRESVARAINLGL